MKYCVACLLLLFTTIFVVMAEEGLSKSKISELTVRAKNKDYAAVWQLAAYYRTNNDLKSPEELLKKYTSPIGFEKIPPKDSVDYLKCLLETAHLRALKDDVSGALALLSWAEGRNNDFQRAVSCLKYAEILLDLGEFERADAYLKNVREITVKNIKEENTAGAALGQGGETLDTDAVWRELQDKSVILSYEIEAEQLKEKFGAGYSLYVKLRRMQNTVKRLKVPRYQKEALKLADEIIATDPASQFAAAAGYLKGEILADKLTDKSPAEEIKTVKDYLGKFVKTQPDGLYHGEALMLLGKISLEIEWNAKDAEKYYSQALDYFQKSREKRDAMSLYAAMSDDLKKQTAPVQKPATLNQWKRIEYHDEDPLKLYNTANAPVWYVSDKEKNCIFALGFIAFSDEKFDVAETYWDLVKNYSSDDDIIDEKSPATVYKRLLKACRLRGMMFWPEEKEPIKDADMRLKFQYAEYLALLEKFSESIDSFKDLVRKCRNDDSKAIAIVGIAFSNSLWFEDKTHQTSFSYYKQVIDNKKLSKSAIYGRALMECGKLFMGTVGGERNALPLFAQYLTLFKNGRYVREAEYRTACCYISEGKINKAKEVYQKLKNGKDAYEFFLEGRIAEYENNKNNKEL
jgi:tetratricopeptide (TPR) repeat protein